MARVVVTPIAESDLIDIWLHIAHDNETAATALLHRIEEHCRDLAAHPQAGRARPELAANLRSAPVGRYVLFYRPMRDGIELIRVLHGARDIDATFDT